MTDLGLSSSFVRVSGTHFQCGGKLLRLSGANNYYLGHAPRPMVEAVFAVASEMELNVLRTWAFLDWGPPEPGTTDVFFQYWDAHASKPVFNDGPNGLERLDQVIAAAEHHGIRLILTIANYWPDFGGADQYLKWFGFTRRDEFFRNEDVKRAYRDYAQHLLHRVNTRTGRLYSDEPAILAWELMNEPRCRSKSALLDWIEEMSGFVKSLDANHLVAVGDEGSIDCERILRIRGVDFGTYHLYPHFGKKKNPGIFGADWIRDHIECGKRLNKPMLLEEYGFKGAERDAIYQVWLSQVLESDGAGALVWMIASKMESGELYPDYDGYTIYAAQDVPAKLAFSRAVNDPAET